jgi:ABC-type multidrug transport system ATPase subunit
MILNNAGIITSYDVKTQNESREGVLFIKNDESIYSYITIYDALLFFRRVKIETIRINKIKATNNQMKDLIDFFCKRGYTVITEEENYFEV